MQLRTGVGQVLEKSCLKMGLRENIFISILSLNRLNGKLQVDINRHIWVQVFSREAQII